MAIIRIKNLLLRTYIGFNKEEINKLQDVVINMTVDVDLNQAIKNDSVDNSYNYKIVTKNVISLVQGKKFKMLEKLTQSILDEIMKNKKVRFARVEVDKPHALRFAESVSVEMEATRDKIHGKNYKMENDANECIIGIGSNINPEKNIDAAVTILKQEINVSRISAWVKTAPIGIISQNDFVNGAIKVRTSMSREEFKNYLKNLEDRLGRDRTLPKFGPRVIDLDIIVWNNEIIDNDYYTRDFVRESVDELR